MGRPGKIWRRNDRPGWYATISGKQVNLGTDHAEATREYHRLRARAAPPSGRATTAESVDRFLEHAEPHVQPDTFTLYRYYLQSWCDHTGKTRATTIEPRHVQGWMERHPGWNSSTRHLAITIVKLWSRWALDPDPLRRVKRPKMGRRQPPAPGALEAVLAAFPSQQARDIGTVLYETGCRPGEIRTLEASGVAWERSTAIVRGKTGPRLIGLSPRALDVLKRNAALHPTGPVLRSTRGVPWTGAAIHGQFRRAARKLGVGPCCPYHCRHAFWARAHKAGIGDVAVAKQLGHKSLHMLATVYAEADHMIMANVAKQTSSDHHAECDRS